MSLELHNYPWDTTFATAQNLMIHTFTKRVSVVTNINTGSVKVLKDDIVIDRHEDVSIKDYIRLLLNVSKSALVLDNLNQNDNT